MAESDNDYIEGWAFSVIPVYVSKDLQSFWGRGPISGFFVHVTGPLWEFVSMMAEVLIPDFEDPGVPIRVNTKDLD